MLTKPKDKNILIIIICVTLLLSCLFTLSMVEGHDTIFHIFRIVGIAQNISHGNVLAKIHYNSINNLGYGVGIFYPQLNLLLPSIIYMITNNINISIKIYIYISILSAGLIMYFYLTNISKNKNTALIGSLLYIFAPYIYVQSIFRGAYGEMAGFISLPLIFWGLELISKDNKYGDILLIIGSVYILGSHVISTIYIALFSLLYILFNSHKFLKKKPLMHIGISLITVILLSLYFIIPFIEHYIYGGYNMMETHFNPSKNIIFLPQLLFSSGNMGYSKGGANFKDELPYAISVLIVTILILLPSIYSKVNNNKNLKSFLILGIITIFMMCCPFIWGHIKILDIIQAPYRLLMPCVFFLVVVDVYILDNISINNYSLLLLGIIILSLFQINPYITSSPLKYSPYTISDKSNDRTINLFDFINGKERVTTFTIEKAIGAENDYLLTTSDAEYIINRSNSIIPLDNNEIEIKNYYNELGNITANIYTPQKSRVELPLIYYLGYNIKNNNQSIRYEVSEHGLISVDLKKGINNLKISYQGTTLDKLGNIISILSFTIFIIYVLNLKYKFISKNK